MHGINKFIGIVFSVVALNTLNSCQRSDRKPGICLSFDDRSIAGWYAMRDLLKQYHAKTTFFITQFDSLTPKEIEMLKELESDGHEISSHGALHVSSEKYIKEYSYSAYLANEVERSLVSMGNAGFHPTAFAYPYGAKYWFTDLLITKKVKVTRGVAALEMNEKIENLDDIYYDFDGRRNFYALGIDTNSGFTRDMVVKAVKRARDSREVLFLYGHQPTSVYKSGYFFDVPFLKFILEQAREKHLQFYTFSELQKKT